MILRLQRFDFDITYKKGSEMFLADMLSRSKVKDNKCGSDRDILCDVFKTEEERSHIDREIESVNIGHATPNRPWQKVCSDLFELQKEHFLVCVDYYSDFIEVDKIYDKKGKSVISKLKSQFARHGIPNQVVSDNGPPYHSKELAEFSKEYEFEHKTSSPRYPQSNGKAENAVKIAKKILQKANYARSDPNLALLAYLNTPTEGVGSFPAHRLFGRRTTTLLPTSDKLLKPKTERHTQKKLEGRRNREKCYYDRGAKNLKELKPGDVVRIKMQDKHKEWVKAKSN